MENYYVRILTKNMRNVYVEAHRRAMKEYYPPHLTGPGSRGVGLLDMVFFGQAFPISLLLCNILAVIETHIFKETHLKLNSNQAKI